MASRSNSSTSTKSTSSSAGDSCTWYAGENCTRPRTGFDCLNKLLETDECAIDPVGACVSVSVYENYLADREYYEPLSKYFPASSYSYCNATDSVCTTCISEWTTNYETTGTVGSTTYCTGSDGCVCVAAVEVSDWQQTVVAYQCSSSNAADSAVDFSSGTRIGIILAMCVGSCIILAIFAVRRYLRVGPRNFGPGSIPRASPKGPQLSLAGWKSLREKLIETEHGFVEGGTARLDETVRSAEATGHAPTVTVEVAPRPSLPPPYEARLMAPV